MLQKNRSLFFRGLIITIMFALQFSCEQRNSQTTNVNPNPMLPFGLTIDQDSDFKGGFTIREADGFALIGKGVSYRDIDLQVEVLVGYGVQEAALAAEVIDVMGATRFIKVVRQLSPLNQPYKVSFVTELESKGNDDYQWVTLSNNK